MRDGLLAAFIVVLSACSEDAGEQKPEALRLPDACYGTWELVSSGGGIDGSVSTEGAGRRMLIRRDNFVETAGPDGEKVERRFTVKKGRSIFSADESFFIVYRDDPLELVVQLAPDGTGMSLSQNVYDGFGTSYRRVEE